MAQLWSQLSVDKLQKLELPNHEIQSSARRCRK